MAGSKARITVATLALSAVGFVAIVRHEGYEPVAKPPVPGDVCTGGFGTTEGVKCGDRIEPVKAVERALRDVGKFESAIRQCVKVPLSQGEYDAAVSFTYNLGGKTFCESSIVELWNAGDYAGGCAAFSKYVCGPAIEETRAKLGERCYSKKKPMRVFKGLENRRAIEREWCEEK